MDRSDVGRSLLGESPQVTRLRARHLEVVERLTGELAEARRSVPLVGLAVRNAELRRLAPRAQHTVRVMQTDYAFDPEDPGLDLSSGLATRGVSTELITRPTTPRTHPLLSSIYPGTLLGPVFVPCMIIDDHTALVAGPDDAFGLAQHRRDDVANPEAGWAARNPNRALAFLFVTPRDCAALDELMAL